MATSELTFLKDPPRVSGIPVIGNVLRMAQDPAQFFVDCYRRHGPVFRIRVFNRTYTVLAGAEAATFMGTRQGKDSLRSREFWQGLIDEWGATRLLTAEDGETHARLRSVMRHGYSSEAANGRYRDLLAITDTLIDHDWRTGRKVAVLPAMQALVTEQLGALLAGTSPREYVTDIRTTIYYILNVLVTRQWPKFMLKHPRYRHAKQRVTELGERMIADYRASQAQRDPAQGDPAQGDPAQGDPAQGDPAQGDPARRNLVDDIMEAHERDPDLVPANDLILSLTGPFVAGLDTVANTTSAFVYAVLKHPEVLRRVQAEVDALFQKQTISESDLKQMPALQGAIMESMRLYPIAVAQMRTATRDFEFRGHLIKANELLYVATSVPHFMEEYFPDPQRFDIDRYAKPRAEHLQSGAYSPYGRGPHTCLGKTLAEVQMALTLARLFYKLDLALESPGYELERKTLPTPGPSMKFKVQVKGRRH